MTAFSTLLYGAEKRFRLDRFIFLFIWERKEGKKREKKRNQEKEIKPTPPLAWYDAGYHEQEEYE